MTKHHTRRLLFPPFVFLLFLGTAQLSSAASVEPQFTYSSLSGAQAETVDWALGLFEDAGLELPNIEFVGYDDPEMCHGRAGSAQPVDGGALVKLCTTEIGPTEERWILHEVAHTWDYHNLDDQERASFLALRGLDAWSEGEWHERGSENAAEMLVWGLIDRPFNTVHIYDNSCADLRAGYLELVGVEPLHGYTDLCSK